MPSLELTTDGDCARCVADRAGLRKPKTRCQGFETCKLSRAPPTRRSLAEGAALVANLSVTAARPAVIAQPAPTPPYGRGKRPFETEPTGLALAAMLAQRVSDLKALIDIAEGDEQRSLQENLDGIKELQEWLSYAGDLTQPRYNAPLSNARGSGAGDRQRGVCAIGALRVDGSPQHVGSGFVVDGTWCLLCSCAHELQAAERLHSSFSESFLDPAKHGVAIGFSSGAGRPIEWRGLAALRRRSDPPPEGLDLIVLQMTQALDGSPLPEGHVLDALPLGDAKALKAGDDLTILGFPIPAKGMSLLAMPVFGKFSLIDRSARDGPLTVCQATSVGAAQCTRCQD